MAVFVYVFGIEGLCKVSHYILLFNKLIHQMLNICVTLRTNWSVLSLINDIISIIIIIIIITTNIIYFGNEYAKKIPLLFWTNFMLHEMCKSNIGNNHNKYDKFQNFTNNR